MAKAKDGKPTGENVKRETVDKTQPKGAYLTRAAKDVRDSLIVQRKTQNWQWARIAKEAGIGVQATKNAYKAKVEEYERRPVLDARPLEILEDMTRGIYLSIGDFESMAVEALAIGHVSAAVGAKRSANDARKDVIAILQSTGRLPRELGTLRYAYDLRQIAGEMLDQIEGLRSGERTAEDVAAHFRKLVGIDEQEALPPPPDADVVE